MPTDKLIAAHREVQNAAKLVLDKLALQIDSADTEQSISEKAFTALCEIGFKETWYYSCPAFVLLGTRSCLSISGRNYVPALEPVGQFNLVTVDLSPLRDTCWGDCARSFFIEDGFVTDSPKSSELRQGKEFLKNLHADMQAFVSPETTFHDLFDWTNQRIRARGFENLDFLGNVGHSIAARREDRKYIERDNHLLLNEIPFFTFEPHVRMTGGSWGFKHENIFYFNESDCIEEL